MKFNNSPFIPLLLGANLNSYSLAREFHEEYKIKSIVIGKYIVTQIIDSKILDFIQLKEIENESLLLEKINQVAKENSGKKIILLGCSDTMLKIIMKNKANLRENIIAPYIDITKAERLMNKEEFYKLCEEYEIPYPKTFIYNAELGNEYTLPFSFPVILKPSDQPQFFSKKFEGQKKVYVIKAKTELDLEIQKIYKSNYKGSLIIQEFIDGDDSYMYVLNAYVDQYGKVSFMSFANILLEEHTPTARGNHAIIVNDYNVEVCNLAKTFLEKINYTGFANFDIKYDQKDQKYKFFEINLRQGNSHYHVTSAGYNMAKILVDDRFYNKETKLVIVNKKKLFLIVPHIIGIIFVKRKEVRKEMLHMMFSRQVVNPLYYYKDISFKRWIYLTINSFGQIKKFIRYYK